MTTKATTWGSPFERLRRVRRALDRLRPIVGPRWTPVAGVAGLSFLAGVSEAAVLSAVAFVASAISTGRRAVELAVGPFDVRAGIGTILAVAAIAAVARLVLQLVLAWFPARLSGDAQRRARDDVFGAFVNASWAEQSADEEGYLQELMGNQATQVGVAVLHTINVVSASLMFATLVITAFVMSATIAAVITVTVMSIFTLLRPMSRRVRRRSAATSATSVALATRIAESVRLAQEVRVFGVTDHERARVSGVVRELRDRFVQMRGLSRVVPVLYEASLIFLVIGGLALLFAFGSLEVASVGAVVLLFIRGAAYGQQLQTAYQAVGEAAPYLERLADAIDRYGEAAPPPGTRRVAALGAVRFANVSFSYTGQAPYVLHDIDFDIRPREVIGIVGPTGAGKSTLVQLLLRLRAPTRGAFLVGDVPAADIDDEAWHRKVAYLPQEPHLVKASPRENVRFFRDWIDEPAVTRAMRLAHIADEVDAWADGPRAIIGERADGISGGQRQRLCLARALAGEPELLVLDEPTSALDPQSERLIAESLVELRGRLTMVIVAHRLSTLEVCDRIMVIEDGRLQAFSGADELLATNDFYRRAFSLASHGAEPV